MELPIRWQTLCTISLLSILHWCDAQFYGSYGRSANLGPITFPQASIHNQNRNVQLEQRINIDDSAQPETFQRDYRAAAAAAVALQAAGKQISKGSEQFSFDMFFVSSIFQVLQENQNF